MQISRSTECSVGTYGEGCGAFCSCHNGGSCDPATGECQCRPGWVGSDCSEGELFFIKLGLDLSHSIVDAVLLLILKFSYLTYLPFLGPAKCSGSCHRELKVFFVIEEYERKVPLETHGILRTRVRFKINNGLRVCVVKAHLAWFAITFFDFGINVWFGEPCVLCETLLLLAIWRLTCQSQNCGKLCVSVKSSKCHTEYYFYVYSVRPGLLRRSVYREVQLRKLQRLRPRDRKLSVSAWMEGKQLQQALFGRYAKRMWHASFVYADQRPIIAVTRRLFRRELSAAVCLRARRTVPSRDRRMLLSSWFDRLRLPTW